MPDDEAIERAADALYGAPLRDFVTERKRLADELRRLGRRDAAATVLKFARPSVSAWTVNLLWRHARDDFDALLAAAERIRAGNFAAMSEQRAALGRLRSAAQRLLMAEGRTASEAVLVRVGTTLQALAAIGSFEPDRPGRLIGDRDPPGFESMALLARAQTSKPAAAAHAAPAGSNPSPAAEARSVPTTASPRDASTGAERERRRAELAQLEHAAERAERELAERQTVLAELRSAERDHHAGLDKARAEADRVAAIVQDLRSQLAAAEATLQQARGFAERAARSAEAIGARVADAAAAVDRARLHAQDAQRDAALARVRLANEE